jgi:hypothetical protein
LEIRGWRIESKEAEYLKSAKIKRAAGYGAALFLTNAL